MKEMEEGVIWLVLCFVNEPGKAFIIVISVFNVSNLVIFFAKGKFASRAGVKGPSQTTALSSLSVELLSEVEKASRAELPGRRFI